ncbi:unnamed protein product, partial [Allacma fusca]
FFHILCVYSSVCSNGDSVCTFAFMPVRRAVDCKILVKKFPLIMCVQTFTNTLS